MKSVSFVKDNGQKAIFNEADINHITAIEKLNSVARGVYRSIQVELLSAFFICMIVYKHRNHPIALTWFYLSVAINTIRIILCISMKISSMKIFLRVREYKMFFDNYVKMHCLAATSSGLVWALLPFLSDELSYPLTVFYLTAIYGVTAGCVIYGSAFASISICFITPTLLSLAVSLLSMSGFDRNALAVNVLLYFAVLIRGSIVSERQFREAPTALAVQDQIRSPRDSLTGIPNRNGFLEDAEVLIASYGSRACLLMLDLYGFKSINDTYGHKVGDSVLIEVGRRIGQLLPKGACFARTGGDEFAILYDFKMTHRKAEDLSSDIVSAVMVPFPSLDKGRVGVSIGICYSREDDIDTMMAHADAALCEAKAKGRNQHYVFDDGLRNIIEMRRGIERDFPPALMNEDLQVWFQPIVGDGGFRLDSVEALLRWQHPRFGWVPPPEIIKVASLDGMLEPLTWYVIDRACLLIADLIGSGQTNIRVAVNLSPSQMVQLPIDDIVIIALHRNKAPADLLEIEITEDTAISVQEIQVKLNRLNEAGVRIAIDDFGVGYSSLSSLRELRASRVKIDKIFIAEITTSLKSRALVEAVLHLGRGLEIEVVAEGVESAEQATVLREMGCEMMQGYYFAKPMDKRDIVSWVSFAEH